MPTRQWLILLLLSGAAFLASAAAGDGGCSSNTAFSSNRVYAACSDLPQLSSALHWSYDSAAGNLSIAFVATPPSSDGWVAWAINPTAAGMVGCQTLIAFRQADGKIAVKTYSITGYGPVKEGPIIFEPSDLAADSAGGAIRLYASLKLPVGTTTVNQVWQVGATVADGVPQKHDFKPENMDSKGTVDLVKGSATVSSSSVPRSKTAHGILNLVSWGILLPIGAIFARHVKRFNSADPAWFYLHISCQVTGYAVGVAGWVTGLVLGSKSPGIVHTAHRNIGIALFTFCTLQVTALFVRPKKDHKYRMCWNVYHHSVGYSVIVMGVVNVFKGLEILRVDRKWTVAYTAAICAVAAVALFLEIFTWILVLLQRRIKSNDYVR